MIERLLISDELRLRIIALEYQDLSKEEYIKEIHRIYIEEMGESLPAKIAIYRSEESGVISEESQYVGSAIRFYSEENSIDEVYIVSEGTQGFLDWLYNVGAMVAGMSYDQIDDVDNFTKDALDFFEYEYNEVEGNYSVPVVGLGHSQAHNTNVGSYLIHDTFTSVHSVNGAQANFYQLYFADNYFSRYLIDHYPILKDNQMKIYDLDSTELKKHAEEYYKDKADNIYQIVSENDPLYAARFYPGFFSLGQLESYQTNKDVSGLSELFRQIPETYFQKIQQLAVHYTMHSDEGWESALYEMMGLDFDVLNELFQADGYIDQGKVYLFNFNDIDEMIRKSSVYLPDMIEVVEEVTSNIDDILLQLHNEEYITIKQKEDLNILIKNIEEELLEMEKAINQMNNARNRNIDSSYLGVVVSTDVASAIKIKNHGDNLMEYLESLNSPEYKKILISLIDSHGIEELLAIFTDEEKRYLGTDMLFRASNNEKTIWVNLFATVKMSVDGKTLLLEKKEMINELSDKITVELYESFEYWKTRIRNKIGHMEQSPESYDEKFRYYMFKDKLLYQLDQINVHEVLPRIEDTELSMEQELRRLNDSVESGLDMLTQYRDSIEKLFEEDMRIAEKIDLMEDVYHGK